MKNPCYVHFCIAEKYNRVNNRTCKDTCNRTKFCGEDGIKVQFSRGKKWSDVRFLNAEEPVHVVLSRVGMDILNCQAACTPVVMFFKNAVT